MIANNFSHNAKGIIVFRDEDPKELEVNSWIPVSKIACGDKIAGIVISGDIEQLEPTVLSEDEEPGFNVFALQMRISLTRHLVHMKHPVIELEEQRRFRPTWLNKRVCKNQMDSHKSNNSKRYSR